MGRDIVREEVEGRRGAMEDLTEEEKEGKSKKRRDSVESPGKT